MRAFLYIVATNMLVVVCLNILISIVTDNYDNVQARILAIDQTKKASMLYDNEIIIKSLKTPGMAKFLFQITYADRPPEEEAAEQQINGKFRQIKMQIAGNHKEIKDEVKEMQQEFNEYKSDVDEVFNFLKKHQETLKKLK